MQAWRPVGTDADMQNNSCTTMMKFIHHRHVAEFELRYHLDVAEDSIHGMCVM